MKSLFTFCLSLLFFTAQAQDYVIDLNKQTLTLAKGKFYISQVIDARFEKSNIGTVQTGAMNSRKLAIFPTPLPQTLMRFIGRHLPAFDSATPVILKVLQLAVSEETKSLSEAAMAKMQVDFIYEQEPGQYQLLYEASSDTKKKGMEVTAFHDNNLAKVINDCLNLFAEQNLSELIQNATALSPQQLEANILTSTDSLAFSILRDTVFRIGAYQNFREFRNNAPSLTQPIQITYQPRTSKSWMGTYAVQPYLKTPTGDKKLKGVWGFSDGKEVYILHEGEYYPLDRNNNVCTFYGHFPIDNGMVPAGYVAGGLVGGAITGAAAASARKNSKTQYVVDMLTGRVTELKNYDPLVKQTVKIIIYYRGSNASDPTNITLTNQKDSLVNALRPNSFLELTWNDLSADLQLCFRSQAQTCLDFIPSVNKTNYFEYSPGDKKSPTPIIRPAVVKEAEFYVKKFRYTQEIEEKRSQRNQQ